MTTRDEAFLILKKWRDEAPLMSVLREFPQTHIEETVMTGETAYIFDVNSESSKVAIGLDRSNLQEVDLTGAEFEYSDRRSTRLLEGTSECSLAVTFSDGALIVFAESPSLSD